MRLSPWLEQLKSPHRQRVPRTPRRAPAVALWRRLEICEPRTLLSTFTVDSFFDTVDVNPGDAAAVDSQGNVTLRSAIMEANALAGDDTIVIGGGEFILDLPGRDEQAAATGDLDVTGNLTITGQSSRTTIIDAGGIDRVFEVLPGITLTLSNLTLRGGDAVGDGVSSAPGDGGGALINSGTLNLNNVRLEGNRAQKGGGIANLLGNLTIDDSTLVNNSAAGLFLPGAGGGIHILGGNTTIRTSTIQDGFTDGNGAGIAVSGGNVTIQSSTIARNVAGELGSGMGDGGGLMLGGLATVDVLATTVAYNNAEGRGAGIFSSGDLTIERTILAENNAPGMVTEGFMAAGTITSNGFNLIRDNTNFMFTAGTGDLIGTMGAPINAMLNVLADYGGPTETISLQPGSPAIDAGPATAAPLNSDQRGFARERDGDFDMMPVTDIGAFEDEARSQIFVDDPGSGMIVGGFAGDWRVDVDNGVAGTLDFGDIVTFDPLGAMPLGGLTFGISAFGSISDATLSAPPDPLTDVVLGVGTYNENVILSHADMHVRGFTGTANDVVIDAGGATFGLEVQENNIQVADLRVTNAMTGIEVNPFMAKQRVTLKNLIIDGVTVDGIHVANISDEISLEEVHVSASDEDGLDVNGPATVHVLNSSFTGNTVDGVRVDNATVAGFENVNVSTNTGRGLHVLNTKTVLLSDVQGTGNTMGHELFNVDVALFDVERGVVDNGINITASAITYSFQGMPQDAIDSSALDAVFLKSDSGNDTVSIDFSGGAPSAAQQFFIDAGSGEDQLLASHDANMTLDDFGLEIDGVATVSLRAFDSASLTGGASANVIDAGRFAGHVTVSGAGGDDQLISGPGDDILNGDDGQDTLSSSQVIIERRFAEAGTFEAIDLDSAGMGVVTILDETDNGTATIDLPMGTSFRSGQQVISGANALTVHNSGVITFITTPPLGDNVQLSRIEQKNLGEIGVIAPLWDDWVTGFPGLALPDAKVLYRFEDTNADMMDDRLVIEWNEVYHRDQINMGGPSLVPGASPVTFQAILELNTFMRDGDITFNYVDVDANDAMLDDGATATVGVRQQSEFPAFAVTEVSFNAVSPLVNDMQAIRDFSNFSDGNDQLFGGADDDRLELVFGSDNADGEGGNDTLRIDSAFNPFASTNTLTGTRLTSVFSPEPGTQITSQVDYLGVESLDLHFGAGDQTLDIPDFGALPATVRVDAGGPSASDSVTVGGSAVNDLFSVQNRTLFGDGRQLDLLGVEHLTIDLSAGGNDEVTVSQNAAGSLMDVQVLNGDGTDTLDISSTTNQQEVRVEQSGVELQEQLGLPFGGGAVITGELLVVETLVNNMLDGAGSTIRDQDNPHDVAVSPDGLRVYVASRDSDALVVYDRNADSGRLSFVESLVNGMNDSQANLIGGLDEPTSVAVSLDSGHVYVGSDRSATVAAFRVDDASNRLVFESSTVEQLPMQNPFDGIHRMSFSTDGRLLLVAAERSDRLITLERDPTAGQLRFVSMVTNGDPIPIEGGGTVTGLDGASSVAVSPDGQFFYVTGFNDNSVVTFSMPFEETGTPIMIEALVDGGMDGSMNVIGGLKGATSVAVNPDGTQVYVTGETGNTLAVFNRDAMTGLLTFVEALVDNGFDSSGTIVAGLATPGEVTTSPDGSLVFVGVTGENGVSVFERDLQGSGRLTYVETLKVGGNDALGVPVTGLTGAFSVAVPVDGRNLYALGETDDSVAVFKRPLHLKVSTNGGAIPVTVTTQDSDDVIKVSLGQLPSNDVTVDAGGPADMDSIDLVGSNGNDVIDVNGDTILFSGNTVNLMNAEDVTVSGSDGDDTFNVTPSTNTPLTILGGDALGDLLDFTTPVSETATYSQTGSTSGSIAATGGHQTIMFDEVESLGFSGDLIVEGSADDDRLDVTATGTNSGSLRLTTDVDNSAGGTTAGPTVNITTLNSLRFNGQAENDQLMITNPAGDVFKPAGGVVYDGGGEAASGGDDLVLSGGAAAMVTHSLTNSTDGSVAYDGTTFINYSDLEPVLDTITATDRVFSFTSPLLESIFLRDDTVSNNGRSEVDSTHGEVITFANPSGSLTLQTNQGGGSGADIIRVEGVDGNWDADISIDGDNDDTVRFAANPTDAGTGNVSATGKSVIVNSSIVTSGSGQVSLDALADNASDLDISGAIATDQGDISLRAGRHVTANANGDLTTNAGHVQVLSSQAAGFFGGGIAFQGDITTGTGDLTTSNEISSSIDGVISGSGDFRKQGNAQLNLNATNTHTGITHVEDGFIVAKDAGSLGAASAGTIVSDSATLNLDPFTFSEPITLNGNGHNLAGQTGALVLNDSTVSSPITLQADSRIRSNGNSEISGAIGESGGARALTLQTAAGSILTLSGSGHTYSGATMVVDPGTLLVTGSTPAASPVTINAGTTLGGTGTIGGALTVSGTLTPGLSPGILNASDVTLADNSILDIEIGGASPGNTATSHDQIDATGFVNIGANVTLNTSSFNNFVPNAAQQYEIINRTGGTGTFTGLAEGATIDTDFLGSGFAATITYTGGDGDDIVIIVGTDLVLDGGAGDDTLTITATGTDSGSRMLNLNGVPGTAVAFSGVTSVTFNAGDGSDSLVVMNPNGSVFHPGGGITFNGQGGAADSDTLSIQGGLVSDMDFFYDSPNDGSIDYSGAPAITYTGLEPVTSTVSVTNITLNYSAGDDAIVVRDNAGQTQVDSTLGEITTFNNPGGSLTIDTGGGNDTLTLESLGTGWDADLAIDGGSVTVTGLVDLDNGDANFGVGSVIRQLDFDPDATLQTIGGDVVIRAGAGGITSQLPGTTDIVANSLSIVSAAAIGTASRPIETDVMSLETDTSDNGSDQFIDQSDVLNDISLNAGVGRITLTSSDEIADNSNDGTDIIATTATIALQFGSFGTAGGADAIDTDVDSLSVDTSGGNGNQFINESSGLADLSLNAGIGNIVLDGGGTIEDRSTDGRDIIATNATITLASGDVGTAVSGGEIDLEVSRLTIDTSAGNGTQRVIETDGLSDLDLNAGTGDVHLTTGGAVEDDSDDGTDIHASSAVVTQTAGSFGSAAKPVDTEVHDLTVNTSAGNGSQFISENNDLQSLNLDAGTGNVILTAADSIEDADASADVSAAGAALTAAGGIGSASALDTRLSLLALSNSGSGNVDISNSVGGTLTIGTVGPLTGVTNTAGSLLIANASPLVVNESVTASSSVTLVASDSAATGDDLTVNGGVTIQSTGSDVTLQAGDDVSIAAAATLNAAGRVHIEGDAGNADAGTGSTIEVLGTLISSSQARINGDTDDDFITLNPEPGSSGTVEIDGRSGDDSYDIVFGNLGGQVDVVDAAGEGANDTLSISGTAGNDAVTIDANATASGGRTITYTGNLESLSFKGDDGDDQVTVTAFGGAPALMLDGGNHAGGDTLTVDAQQRTASDSGTQVTVTGLQSIPHVNFETVSIVNTPPNIANQSFNIGENSSSGTVIGTVIASDPDDGTNLTWRITAGNTGNVFAINPVNGQLRVNGSLNHEGTPSFNLTVEVEDSDRLKSSATVTVNVNDVNDNPVITSAATAAIDENTTSVLTVTATDEDVPAQGISFGLAGGADQGFFVINPMTGALSFETAPDFDAREDSDGNNVYDVMVRAIDSIGGFTDQAIAVTVNNVEEAPIVTPVGNQSVDEDQTLTLQVAAVDPEGGNLEFSLVPTPMGGGGGMIMSSSMSVPPPSLASITRDGQFTFTGMPLAAGFSFPITVSVLDDSDLSSTTTFTVTVDNVALDYGDAPQTFGTRFGEDGARHLIGPLFLGDIIDDEVDGIPSANAMTDDVNASLAGIGVPGDDEDGVTFLTALFQGSRRQARVIASEDGFLDAWIDFNQNGTFDPNEHLFQGNSLPVDAGFNNIGFQIPGTARLGPTYARFRLSSDGSLPPTGRADDGEVEDYAIQIDPPPPFPQPGFEESLDVAVDAFFDEFPDELNEPDPTATGDELPLQIQAEDGATVERVDGDVDGMMTDEGLRDVVELINETVDALTDRQPGENILVFAIHPVDFRLRDPRGRTVGFTRDRGFENQIGRDAVYSGNGVVELLTIRNALPGAYSLQLIGVGGIFRGGASLITPRSTPRVTFQGSLAVGDSVQLALTYQDRSGPQPPLLRPGRGPDFARVADRLRGISTQDPSVVGQAALEAVAELNRLRADAEQFSEDQAPINSFGDLFARIGEERDRILFILRETLDKSLPVDLDLPQETDRDQELLQLLELLQKALGQQVGPISETEDVEATIRRLLKLLEERRQNQPPADEPAGDDQSTPAPPGTQDGGEAEQPGESTSGIRRFTPQVFANRARESVSVEKAANGERRTATRRPAGRPPQPESDSSDDAA